MIDDGVTSHRILLFCELNVVGGVDTFITTLINHWPHRNDRFTVVCNWDHPGLENLRSRLEYPNEIFTHNFNWYHRFSRRLLATVNAGLMRKILVAFLVILRYTNFFLLIFRIKKLFVHRNHDRLLVVNGGYPGGDSCRAASIAWRLAGKLESGIHNFHNFASPPPRFTGFIENRIDRYVERSSAQLVTVSRACMESLDLRKSFAKSSKRMFIHNGIARPKPVSSEQTDNFRLSIGVTDHCALLLMLASYEERKGHRFILDVFQFVYKDIPLSHLVMCGSGSELERSCVQEQIISMNLSSAVTVLPFQDNPNILLASAQILVVPSQFEESFGLVIAEAMAHRVPVVATMVGGIPEVIEDGISGYLCDPSDPHAMATQIVKVLMNPASTKNLVEAGYERYQQKFTAQRMADEYANLLIS